MSATTIQDHHMPAVEAMLAGTLALMTGYSQFLQASVNPAHRVCMGEKITRQLAFLAEHDGLSPDCRNVLRQLHERWSVMTGCTLVAASDSAPETGRLMSPAAELLQ